MCSHSADSSCRKLALTVLNGPKVRSLEAETRKYKSEHRLHEWPTAGRSISPRSNVTETVEIWRAALSGATHKRRIETAPVHLALTMVALAKHFDELQTTPERLAIPAHAQMQSARMQMPAEISAVTARAV